MHGIDLPEDERPYLLEIAKLPATVVGIRAEDGVGKLTHPDTDVHAHVLFVDPRSGERVTAHVERAVVSPGAVVELPDPGAGEGR